MASYYHFLFLKISFLLICSTPARGSQVGLWKSQDALSSHIQKVSSVQHHIADLRKIHNNNKSLIACSEVINEGNRLLCNVRRQMVGVTRYNTDTSISLQTMLSAAHSYVRTCSWILKEAQKHQAPQFGTLLHQVDDVGNDCQLESLLLRSINKATIPAKKPKLGSTFRKMPSSQNIMRTLSRIPHSRRFTVAQDGTGQFSSINAAIAAAPVGATDYFLIIIKAGRYNEKVTVPQNKPFLVLAGAGKHATVITGNRSTESGYSTWDSATVEVFGDYFIGYKIGVENSAGPEGGQAVALLSSTHQSVYYKCSFKGYQDTLFAHAWMQFYRECDIYGTVDFITGDASAVFQSCNIVLREPLRGQSDPIVAQGRQCPDGRTGFTIQNSRVLAAKGFTSDTKAYLGRSWGKCARVAYISNHFDVQIDPAGWTPWNEIPSQVYLGEFNNTGLGADMTHRVAWPGVKRLTAPEAYKLTVGAMLGGGSWLDRTLVPYVKGLF